VLFRSPTFFRLYVKWPEQNTFAAVDWKAGKQVKNLIYASFFTEMEKDQIENDLVKHREKNPGMQWDWRKSQ
jgi:hypothetical protein